MASRETTDLRNLSDEQLTRELDAAHQALFNLRFQSATRQLADVSQVRKARKRVARARTLLTEREILAEADRLGAARAAAAAESEAATESEGE